LQTDVLDYLTVVFLCTFSIIPYLITRNRDDMKENRPRSLHGVINPYRSPGKEHNANIRVVHTTVSNPYKKTNVNFKEGCPCEVMCCVMKTTSCNLLSYVYMRPHSFSFTVVGKRRA
jgi:hypothetical protein